MRARPCSLALGLGVIAAILRLVHGVGVPVPSTDGATYLAMAEAFARGDFAEGLSAIFHPGWPLLLAPLIALGCEPLTAAVVLGSLLAGFGVACCSLAVSRVVARRLAPRNGEASALVGAATAIALGLLVLGFHLVRLPADAYSEAAFAPSVAAILLASLSRRALVAAALVGVAAWIRPEGIVYLALPLLLVERGVGARPPRRLLILVLAIAIAAAYPLLRALVGIDAAWTPKFGFMAELGPLGAGGFADFFSRLAAHLIEWPSSGLRGLDFVTLPFAILGWILLFRTRVRAPSHAESGEEAETRHREDNDAQSRGNARSLAWATALVFALASAAMLAFQVKPRFFIGHAPLLVVLASVAIAECLARSSREHQSQAQGLARLGLGLVGLGLVVAAVRVAKDIVDPPRVEKLVEVELGHWLARKGVAQQQLVTDLPRVAWAAGHMPLPPRQWTAERLAPLLDADDVEWIVLGARRKGRQELLAGRPSFERIELPLELRDTLGAERLLVARRR